MKFFFSIFVILISFVASAKDNAKVIKEKKVSSNINFSFASQYYFDKLNVANANKGVHPIQPYNIFGYSFELEYELITRFGLIFDAGAQYGIRRYKINIIHDMSNFDPTAINNLSGALFDTGLKFHTQYFGPHLLLGYKVPLDKDWSISFKAGATANYYLTAGYFANDQVRSITYETDNTSQIRTSEFLRYSAFFGNNKSDAQHLTNIETYSIYIGIDRKINKGWIKNFSVGIEASRKWGWDASPNYMTVTSISKFPSTDPNNINNDYYYDRNVSIGLKLTCAFGKYVKNTNKIKNTN